MSLLLLVSMQMVSVELSAEPVEQPVFIDVRTWAEHQIDHIDGDPRIHVSEIVSGVQNAFPNKQTPIRLYCAKGGRAQTATNRLREAGYLNVKNMGGIDDVRQLRSIQD